VAESQPAKHERDCHSRVKEGDRMLRNRTLTKIGGTRFFEKISLQTIHERQMRIGHIVHSKELGENRQNVNLTHAFNQA
jgi:hypothetical protein